MKNHKGLLSNQNFKNYTIGIATSNVGNVFYGFAASWYILSITHSATQLATFLLVGNITRALMLTVSGKFVDNHDKIKVMVVTDIIRFIVIGPLALIIYFYDVLMVQIIFIYCIHILLNITDAFFEPASRAIIPNIVKKEDLTKAWSVFSLIDNIQYAVAMLLVGILYSLIGFFGILIINSFTFLLSAVFNKQVTIINNSVFEESAKKNDLLTSVKWIFSEKEIFQMISISSVFSLFTISLNNIGFEYIYNQVLKVLPFNFSTFNFIGIIGSILMASLLLKNETELSYFYEFKKILLKFIVLTTIIFILIYIYVLFQINVTLVLCVLGAYNFLRLFLLTKISTTLNASYSKLVPTEKLGSFYALKELLNEIIMGISLIIGGALLDKSVSVYFVYIIAGFIVTYVFLLIPLDIDKRNN